MSKITTPHDEFFKYVLSQPETAADFLANYLPPEVAAKLDLNSLALVKDSFIDDELRKHFSDLLYQAQLKGGGDVLIYLLFEHKSEPEEMVGFQLLRYMVRAWERTPRQTPNRLPLIIPIVLYHGQATWNAPTQFSQLIEGGADKDLRRFAPSFEIHLIDLSQFDLESLKGEIILRVFLAVLRYVFSEGFGAKLVEIFTLLHRMSGVSAVEYARTILIYASKSSYRPTKEEIEMALEAAFGESYPVIAPFALEWMEEGRVKGHEEGRREGAARIALLLLASRFGEIEEPIQDAIHGLSIEQIEQLSGESSRFQSLDELSDWLLQNTKPTNSPGQV